MVRTLLLTLVVCLASCSCNDKQPVPCPATFTIGDPCPAEGLKCPYPGGKCGTQCTCVNGAGGFSWDCKVENCRCQCSCGSIAIASCEALECRTEQESCPDSAKDICAVVCADGGRPDLGKRDGPKEAGHDGPRDRGPEAKPDAPVKKDGPAKDAPHDTRTDSPRLEGGVE